MSRRTDHIPNGAWPEYMCLSRAAAYCDVSVETFKKVSPAIPVDFNRNLPGSQPLWRYRRRDLDEAMRGDQHARSKKTGIRAFLDGESETV